MIVQLLSVMPRVRRRRHPERGAAAVEMALVLPVLLFLLMGMIDFGRAYSAQIQLSQAAREGVRLASLNTTVVPGSSPEVIYTADAASVNPYGFSAIGERVSQAAGGLASFTAYASTAAECSPPTPTATSSTACVTYCPVDVGTTTVATVVLTSKFTWITGISGISSFIMRGAGGGIPPPGTIQATGVMRCAG